MAQKNANVTVPILTTILMFILSFIGSLLVLAETNIFGTADPANSPEPMTWLGGLLFYSVLGAVIISLLFFYLLSFYYDLSKYLYMLAVLLVGITSTLLGMVLLNMFFTATNFFTILNMPVLIGITTECKASASCINEVNSLIYALILGPCIGVVLMIVVGIWFKNNNKI